MVERGFIVYCKIRGKRPCKHSGDIVVGDEAKPCRGVCSLLMRKRRRYFRVPNQLVGSSDDRQESGVKRSLRLEIMG
jgi:hypothetical protein